MKRSYLVTLLLSGLISAGAQTNTATNTGSAKAGCVSNTGIMSNVTITCTGVPAEESTQLLKMMNDLLRDQKELGPKLDSMQTTLDAILAAESQGGIGNLGERAVKLAQDMFQFSKMWNELDESNSPNFRKSYPTDEQVNRYRDEYRFHFGTSFKFRFWNELKEVRQEFALKSYKNKTLDGIIDLVNSEEKAFQEIGRSPLEAYPNGAERETIPVCLAVLATGLNPSSPPPGAAALMTSPGLVDICQR